MLALALAACAPPSEPAAEPVDPWAACAGIAARETVEASELRVGEHDGTPVLFAYDHYGARWLDLARPGAPPWGDVPFVTFYGGADVLAVDVEARDRVAVITEYDRRVVTAGFGEAVDAPWALAGGPPSSGLALRRAWVVDGEVYVAYVVADADYRWSLGFGRAAADGVVTPLAEPLVAGLDHDQLADVAGGYDPQSDTFVLTARGEDADAYWRVARDGAVAEGTFDNPAPYSLEWAPLGDGRFTVATSNGALHVFDPADPGATATFAEADFPAPFPRGAAFALPDGTVVVASHADGTLTVQPWDGADPTASPASTFPLTYDVCDPFANVPPTEQAR